MRVRRALAALAVLSLPSVARAAAGGYEFLGEFQVTYYWVAVEDGRYDGLERGEVLRDEAGCELARVAGAFRTALDREGTGRLADGRIVNVAVRAEDGWRYVDLGPAHWGLGVAGVPLVPYRSVATDPARAPRGARLHLPAFAGLDLGHGRHGGHFVVDDVGSAIRAARIDLFIGDESALSRFEAAVPSHGLTPVYLWRTGGREVSARSAPPDMLISP